MKYLNKIIRLLFSRVVVVAVLILIQVVYLLVMVVEFGNYYPYIQLGLLVLSFLAFIKIVNTNNDPGYKLAWIIPILLVPLLGGLMYLAFGGKRFGKTADKRLGIDYEKVREMLHKGAVPSSMIEDAAVRQQVHYLNEQVGYPMWQNTEVTYIPMGEVMFRRLVEELEQARHYIFLEYFIIEEGRFWNTILSILERKAKQGVDVRVMYDDMGCVVTLPPRYDIRLRAKGIRCVAFNPFVPFISIRMNHRSHRKMTIIDGHTAFTGGINLADEYINQVEKYGHWKDTGVMLKGEAVWNFTMMYLMNWNTATHGTETDFAKYKPCVYPKAPQSSGYVIPYMTGPMLEEPAATRVYCNILEKAKKYVYITTPYLIPDQELISSLTRAARNGVDVRILTPGHWDKYVIHALTQSHYLDLIEAGVKIYEYTPGFIHAKSFVCDDEIAIVGSINLDYRSLYLHFECAVWMYQVEAVMDVKKDFLQTQTISTEVDADFCKSRPLYRRILGWICKLFAPLV